MKTVMTFELTSQELITVKAFMELVDEMSDVAGISMDEVFTYLANECQEGTVWSVPPRLINIKTLRGEE